MKEFLDIYGEKLIVEKDWIDPFIRIRMVDAFLEEMHMMFEPEQIDGICKALQEAKKAAEANYDTTQEAPNGLKEGERSACPVCSGTGIISSTAMPNDVDCWCKEGEGT